MNKSMDWTNKWSVFSNERSALYGISILSIIIFHYFEDLNASDFSGMLRSIGAVYLRIIGSVGVELFIFLSGISLFCWCGTKVYRESTFNKLERVGFYFGLLLMLGTFIPNTQDIIQKFGDRILMCFWGLFLVYILAIIIEKAPTKMKSILNYLGMMSYELYLTHVAIRAFMNFVGMNTYHIINYILCISVSIILSVCIKNYRRRIAYVNQYFKR